MLQQGCACGLWELWLCQCLEFSNNGGGTARHPQRTEPCQCVCGQPWAYHGPLQGQMQAMQCVAGVAEPTLGAAAKLGNLFVGVYIWFC